MGRGEVSLDCIARRQIDKLPVGDISSVVRLSRKLASRGTDISSYSGTNPPLSICDSNRCSFEAASDQLKPAKPLMLFFQACSNRWNFSCKDRSRADGCFVNI